MENKTVSIIMPIYNAEKYLEQGIQSIIKQTYKQLEIILVDDGSTDRSREIIEAASIEIRVSALFSKRSKEHQQLEMPAVKLLLESTFISWIQMTICLKWLSKKWYQRV